MIKLFKSALLALHLISAPVSPAPVVTIEPAPVTTIQTSTVPAVTAPVLANKEVTPAIITTPIVTPKLSQEEINRRVAIYQRSIDSAKKDLDATQATVDEIQNQIASGNEYYMLPGESHVGCLSCNHQPILKSLQTYQNLLRSNKLQYENSVANLNSFLASNEVGK